MTVCRGRKCLEGEKVARKIFPIFTFEFIIRNEPKRGPPTRQGQTYSARDSSQQEQDRDHIFGNMYCPNQAICICIAYRYHLPSSKAPPRHTTYQNTTPQFKPNKANQTSAPMTSNEHKVNLSHKHSSTSGNTSNSHFCL